MGLDELREGLVAHVGHVRPRRVHGDGHLEPLRGGIDRVEALVAEEVVAVGGEHAAHEAELAHAALELPRGRRGILQRQEGHAAEARALAGQLLVEHGVVGAGQRHRPFRIAQEGQAEPSVG